MGMVQITLPASPRSSHRPSWDPGAFLHIIPNRGRWRPAGQCGVPGPHQSVIPPQGVIPGTLLWGSPTHTIRSLLCCFLNTNHTLQGQTAGEEEVGREERPARTSTPFVFGGFFCTDILSLLPSSFLLPPPFVILFCFVRGFVTM